MLPTSSASSAKAPRIDAANSGTASTSLLSRTTIGADPARMPTLHEAAKPRFFSLRMSVTSGKEAATRSAVSSGDASSTTMTRRPSPWDRRDWMHCET